MKIIGLILSTLCLAGVASAATTLKIATITPEGSQWMQDMRASADAIRDRTEGRVIIKYYGGGSQGTDSQVLSRIRIGALQGGVFTPSAIMEKYGDIGLYGLPMVFDSVAEAGFVRSRLDSKIASGLEAAGFVTFGFAATGFAMIMSNEPVDELTDLKGKRVWVPEGDSISKATMDALSVTPIPLPLTDVYTALQTGALDIIGMSPVGAVILQYHTKLKYVTDVPLIYTIGFMAIDKKAFDKIAAVDQQVMRQVMSELYNEYDVLNLEDDDEAKQALFSAGMKRVTLDAARLAEIRSVLHTSNEQMVGRGVVSAAMYEEMMGYVEQYRSEQATIAASETITEAQ
ncbi:MAG: TRAP transporter substrate-binding protein DctP [Gammaproteobacteria bacterium]|nr:TRAP transporter substrate-binding protein DctP [Gammaproteobacteria bacterium]MDH5302933.1 TRAP transporter substrate-binding protein DctP [Gammaproteobacteria bacterium]MDH5321153.1 TRAP transporter substrate-binding protein DctP [Gammaproteobacteria bacterium]